MLLRRVPCAKGRTRTGGQVAAPKRRTTISYDAFYTPCMWGASQLEGRFRPASRRRWLQRAPMAQAGNMRVAEKPRKSAPGAPENLFVRVEHEPPRPAARGGVPNQRIARHRAGFMLSAERLTKRESGGPLPKRPPAGNGVVPSFRTS